jgi:hypothetical protein
VVQRPILLRCVRRHILTHGCPHRVISGGGRRSWACSPLMDFYPERSKKISAHLAFRTARHASQPILPRRKIQCGAAPHRPHYLSRNQPGDRRLPHQLRPIKGVGLCLAPLAMTGSEHDRRSKGISQTRCALRSASGVCARAATQSRLSRVVKNGERFAIELEDAFAGHEEADILRSQARQSLAETKRLIGLLSSPNRREGAIVIGGRHCGTVILGRPVGCQPFVEEQSAGRRGSLKITK